MGWRFSATPDMVGEGHRPPATEDVAKALRKAVDKALKSRTNSK